MAAIEQAIKEDELLDELRLPSPPPRRLSRSSIDLRDLETQHEKEKIISQSDSVSSIQLRFENYLSVNSLIKYTL